MKTKSIVTKYVNNCAFCGRPCNTEHHLLFGKGIRPLAEADGIKLPICPNCHTMNKVAERIHDNPIAEKLSKMAGQLAWEKHDCANGSTEAESREHFRKRYGESYL